MLATGKKIFKPLYHKLKVTMEF